MNQIFPLPVYYDICYDSEAAGAGTSRSQWTSMVGMADPKDDIVATLWSWCSPSPECLTDY